jgi:Zn-dependent protease
MDDEPRQVSRPGLRIGRVFGVPVIISPTWLILAVFVTVIYSDVVRTALPQLPESLTYLVSFGFVVTLCGSVFLHELGHALVSRYYGIKVRSITLEMLGGHTEMATEADRPKVEALVSLAGPAVSAVLGLVGVAAAVITPSHTLAAQFAVQLAACNIIVAVYNVLPGLPLDGGRALRAVVWAVKGDKHLASRVAGWTGRVVAVATGLAGVVLYSIGFTALLGLVFALLIAAVLWMGATRAIQVGALGARFHLLRVSRLTRRAAQIVTGTPLSEALRQVKEQQGWGVVVVDSAGAPVALMHSAAVAAVPQERRPWVSIDDVSRGLDEGNSWDPDWRGEKVVAAMRRHPSTEYAVVRSGQVLGIVRSADIADVLDPRESKNVSGSGEATARSPQGPAENQQEDHRT